MSWVIAHAISAVKSETPQVELYRAGGHTISELEELFPVTRSTIYRAVARAGGRAAPVSARAERGS